MADFFAGNDNMCEESACLVPPFETSQNRPIESRPTYRSSPLDPSGAENNSQNGEALVGFHEDALSQASVGKAQVLLACVLGLGLAADCSELTILAYILPAAELQLCIGEDKKGWLVSITLLAMAAGSFAWGILGDHLGRRRALISALSVAALFSTVASVMPTYGTFMTARFCSGLGVSGAFPLCFSYLAETCSRSTRSRYTGILHSFWPIGAAAISFIAYFTMPTSGAEIVEDNREHWCSWHKYTLFHILTMIDTGKKCLFQYLATISCSLSLMSYGINFSWTSPYLPILTSNTSIIPMTNEEGSWCAISPIPGCVIGALISANLADRIGRKYTILSLAPVVLACFVGIGYTSNYWWLISLRMVIGIADGAAFSIVPMYVGEIVEPQFRGFLSSLGYLFYITGALVINIIGPAYSIFGSSLISAAIPAIHLLSFALMPESPYYLVKANKYEQAEQSLRMLRGVKDLRKDIEALKEATRQEAQLGDKPVLGDVWRIPSNRKACFIFLITSGAARAAAKAPLMSYTMAVFEEAGTSLSTVNSTIAYCAVELVVAFITTCFIIDRFGKRFLVIVSSMGCAITLSMMAVYFFLKYFDYGVVDYLGWFPLATLIAYNVLFNIGLAFAQMCYLSELFPMNVKANALCLAEIFNCLSAAFCIKMFQMLTDWSGTLAVTFLVFSLWSLVMFGFIVKYVPETKGQSLEEIQVFLKRTPNKSDDNTKQIP